MDPPGTGTDATATDGAPSVTYRVRAGDTLSELAAAFYGFAAAYDRLADANGITDPDALTVGEVLTIPAGARPAAAGDG